MLKKLFKIIIPVVLLLPIILYIAIVITNNCIADKIEKDLIKYGLPENTVLVDSTSSAGKLVGNGNGMQYKGSILISSDLTEQEISEHYGKQFRFIEVTKQENATTDTYWVTCWDENTTGKLNSFIIGLLNLDLRGH